MEQGTKLGGRLERSVIATVQSAGTSSTCDGNKFDDRYDTTTQARFPPVRRSGAKMYTFRSKRGDESRFRVMRFGRHWCSRGFGPQWCSRLIFFFGGNNRHDFDNFNEKVSDAKNKTKVVRAPRPTFILCSRLLPWYDEGDVLMIPN